MRRVRSNVMGKGIIKLDYGIVAQWFMEGKKAEDVKSLLMLPETYTVDYMHTESGGYLSIIVSASDIPEVPDGDVYPTVEPWYVRENGDVSLKEIKIHQTPNKE